MMIFNLLLQDECGVAVLLCCTCKKSSMNTFVTVHEKIDHNAGNIYFHLAPGMLSMTLSALTVQVWWM